MKSLSARPFRNPTPRTMRLVRTLGTASTHLLCVGMSLLPFFFYVYLRLQVQEIRWSSVA